MPGTDRKGVYTSARGPLNVGAAASGASNPKTDTQE